jgi:hypothetical protein
MRAKMPGLENLVRLALRPVARPLVVRIDRRIQPIRDDIDALTKTVSALRDAISAQEAAAREARAVQDRVELETKRDHTLVVSELDALRERFEFTRQELMYEMRYGASGPGGAAAPAVEPRIVNHDRVAAAADDMRVNLGCGHIPLADFINVDGRDVDRVDVIADVHNLPFSPGSLAHVYSAHLLEHFPLEELRRALLPYWITLLRPGGLLTAVVPDTETMISEFTAGRISFEELRLVTFGQQEYDKDFHFNMFSRDSISELLRQAGLEDVRVVACARRNGVCYEMEVEGRRPEASRTAGESAHA